MAKTETTLNVNSISRISAGTVIKGEILSPCDIRIDGTFEGKLQSKGRVVIGETAEVRTGTVIYQGVTLGGTGKDEGKRHPTLGDNVMIGAGAKVLGPFRIGDNSKIAAGAVVLEEIPPDSTAVGIPARVVRRKGERTAPCNDMDQVHIPDPVAQELRRLEEKLAALETELAEIKNTKKRK